MKVLQINAVYGKGSTGVITADIHNLALKSGMDSYVAYSLCPVPPSQVANGYVVGNVLGKKAHAVLGRIGGKQAYYSRLATRRLIEHIQKIAPDIVHLHNLHSNYLHLNMLLDFLAKQDISTVLTMHDCWFYTGGCFHYAACGCYKWLEACGDCPKRFQDTPAYLYDNSSKILRDRKKYFSAISDLTVVGVSHWVASEAGRTFFKDKKIVTIHNGIDTAFFVDTPSDFREKHGLQNKFVILAPANKWLLPVNGETLKTVTDGLPEDCVLVLLGCCDEQKAGLPKNVIPLDFIKDRDELRKIYSAADVLANCTREDTHPLLNLEVQSCGTPVVTYRNTGAQETVDGKCGFTVETGNARELLDTILAVKKIGKASLSENCREWAQTHFDRDKNYEKYIDLYKKIYKEHTAK